jgi:hypothetical protein
MTIFSFYLSEGDEAQNAKTSCFRLQDEMGHEPGSQVFAPKFFCFSESHYRKCINFRDRGIWAQI